MKELLTQILQSNPGVVNLLISGLLLPIFVLVLNSRQNRKIKELESNIDLTKLERTKELEQQFGLEDKQRTHEAIVLSSLYKILFEVQRLQIELSGNCVDYKCIGSALGKFQTSFEKYHSVISDNQIFLSSKVTGHLYTFYQALAELLVELQDLGVAGKLEFALVSVFQHSQELSEQVISIQEVFVKARKREAEFFKKEEMRPVSWCCGRTPPVGDKEALTKTLEELRRRKAAKQKEASSAELRTPDGQSEGRRVDA